MESSGGPRTANFLAVVQICYPLILLFVYLISFTVHSIATARPNNDNAKHTLLGPGGESPTPTSSCL